MIKKYNKKSRLYSFLNIPEIYKILNELNSLNYVRVQTVIPSLSVGLAYA